MCWIYNERCYDALVEKRYLFDNTILIISKLRKITHTICRSFIKLIERFKKISSNFVFYYNKNETEEKFLYVIIIKNVQVIYQHLPKSQHKE